MANLKLGTKLALGFGVLIAVLVALGVTGYVMFNRVDGNVAELSKNALPSVKSATGVERSAFECILEEKNYLLLEKDEIHQKAKEKVKGLMANLDDVDKVARQFNNTALAAKSQEVRKITNEWAGLYEQGVTALKANAAAGGVMNDKGEQVGKEADGYMKAKKAQYMEAKDALAIVNDINALSLETRMNEKGYMLYKEQCYFDVIEKDIAELLKNYDSLEKLHPDANEQRQINDARKATQDYFKAAKAWVEEYKRNAQSNQLTELARTMDEMGNIVGKAAADYLAAKQIKVDKVAEAVFIVAAISDEAQATRLNEKGYIISQGQKYWEGLNTHITALNKLYGDLRNVSTTEEDLRRIETAEKATKEYLQAAKSWVENDNRLKKVILPQMATIGDTVIANAQAAENDAWKGSDEGSQAVQGIVSTSNFIILMALAIGVVLGSLLAFFTTRSITKPINKIIHGLSEASSQVGSAASQVANSSQSLAEGASQQAASLEETSSSLEEMSSMTKTNSDNASQANSLAQETNQVMDRANQAMTQLTESMNEINAAGEQTGKIIKTIDEIAFQTNLLALNAAVEAARAGEAGAGFAVVAEEVRNLAMRAAEAAKTTANLIEGTIKKTKEGAELVARTNEAFSDVRSRAVKVAELVGEIAAASAEQAQGIEQVNKAATEMDKVTQQNAANAEESASASEELSSQAETMQGFVADLANLAGTGSGQSQEGRVAGRLRSNGRGRRVQPVEETRALPAPVARKRSRGAAIAKPAPEQAIPLDDDFRDF